MPRKLLFEDGTPMGWATADGKVFGLESEAVAHEYREQFSARVELFIRAHEWNRGQETRARAIVLDFLAFEGAEEDIDGKIAAMQQTLAAEAAAKAEQKKENMKKARAARDQEQAAEAPVDPAVAPEVPPAPAVAA